MYLYIPICPQVDSLCGSRGESGESDAASPRLRECDKMQKNNNLNTCSSKQEIGIQWNSENAI